MQQSLGSLCPTLLRSPAAESVVGAATMLEKVLPLTRLASTEDALDQTLLEVGRQGRTVIQVVRANSHFALVRDESTAASEQQYFQLGSLSKFLTALCAIFLDSHGLFNLDKAILVDDEDLVPSYYGTPVRITARHVLHHFTGLNVRSFPGYARSSSSIDLRSIVSGAERSQPLTYRTFPLSRVTYSSGAFVLLQLELERLGIDLQDALYSCLHELVGGCDVLIDRPGPLFDGAARAYVHPSIAVPDGALYYPETCSQGLWAQPADLVRVLVAVGNLLRAKQKKHSFAGRVSRQLLDLQYHRRMAMSVLVDRTADGDLYYHHQGANAGYTSDMYSLPQEDLHVIGMTSSSMTPDELRSVLFVALDEVSQKRRFSHGSALPRPKKDSQVARRLIHGDYSNDGMTASVRGTAATVQSAGGFEITLQQGSDESTFTGVANGPSLLCTDDSAFYTDSSTWAHLRRVEIARSDG